MFSDKAFRASLIEELDAQLLHTRLVSWHPAERDMA
jgi:hypothetical protein